MLLAATACGAPAKPKPDERLFGVIGDPGRESKSVRERGINTIVVRLSWRDAFPAEGRPDKRYLAAKAKELERLDDEGFYVIADLGLQDPPAWIHRYPDSRYVDANGATYRGDDRLDNGDVNLVFNTELRAIADTYVDTVTSRLGDDVDAIRIGGSRFNELGYPPGGFWAYDGAAARTRPTGEWRPGQPSPSGEAARFYDWYANQLVDFQNWQIGAVREGFKGPLILLLPGYGLRPGDVDEAVRDDLRGNTSAQRTEEIARAHDWARQIGAIRDRRVWPSTTWLDAQVQGGKPPVAYIADLARTKRLTTFGENTGQGDATTLRRSVDRVRRYKLRGMVWYRYEELGERRYARLKDYERAIRR